MVENRLVQLVGGPRDGLAVGQAMASPADGHADPVGGEQRVVPGVEDERPVMQLALLRVVDERHVVSLHAQGEELGDAVSHRVEHLETNEVHARPIVHDPVP